MSNVLKMPDVGDGEGKYWKAYRLLRLAGFLNFEAWRLRKFSLEKPYMVELIMERSLVLLEAIKTGKTFKDYTESIHQKYKTNNWRTAKRVWDDPIKMLVDAKQRYSKDE